MSPVEEIRKAVQRLREWAKSTSPLPWGQHDTWLNDGGYTEAVTQRDPETTAPGIVLDEDDVTVSSGHRRVSVKR